jgi:tripartite-type tricarboxylate transporter receptor subunit TctC
MKEPDMSEALAPLGMEPVGEGPEPFAKMIAREVNTITKVVENAGIQPK